MSRIATLQAQSANLSNEEKFELRVLELLQKCDTAREFDLIREKTEAVAPNSELTKSLLALIQAKRNLYGF